MSGSSTDELPNELTPLQPHPKSFASSSVPVGSFARAGHVQSDPNAGHEPEQIEAATARGAPADSTRSSSTFLKRAKTATEGMLERSISVIGDALVRGEEAVESLAWRFSEPESEVGGPEVGKTRSVVTQVNQEEVKQIESHYTVPRASTLVALTLAMAVGYIGYSLSAWMYCNFRSATLFPRCSDVWPKDDAVHHGLRACCVASITLFWTFPIAISVAVMAHFHRDLVLTRLWYEMFGHKVMLSFQIPSFFSHELVKILGAWMFGAATYYIFCWQLTLPGIKATIPYWGPVGSLLSLLYANWDLDQALLTIPKFLRSDARWAKKYVHQCHVMKEHVAEEAFWTVHKLFEAVEEEGISYERLEEQVRDLVEAHPRKKKELFDGMRSVRSAAVTASGDDLLPESVREEQEYCRNCGAKLKENMEFCGNCGARREPLTAEDFLHHCKAAVGHLDDIIHEAIDSRGLHRTLHSLHSMSIPDEIRHNHVHDTLHSKLGRNRQAGQYVHLMVLISRKLEHDMPEHGGNRYVLWKHDHWVHRFLYWEHLEDEHSVNFRKWFRLYSAISLPVIILLTYGLLATVNTVFLQQGIFSDWSGGAMSLEWWFSMVKSGVKKQIDHVRDIGDEIGIKVPSKSPLF